MLNDTIENPSVIAETAAVPTVGTPLANPRHEAFVQTLVGGASLAAAYATVYRAASKETAWANGTRLRARQDVQARLRELWAVAADRVLIKPQQLLVELIELATADPAEVSRVVVDPCPSCWPDDALGAAADRWLAGDGEPPDVNAPDPTCKRCRGRGVDRVVNTPTHELSGAARRLYAGAKTKSDGSVEVAIVDQLAARRELHDLLSMKVSRSESRSLSISATVAAPADLSADALLAAWKEGQR